jgi:Asp-tRNA(Asn)/Glu-tRNA(Gln) amidotransferase B subunit
VLTTLVSVIQLFVERALEFEIKRQGDILQNGGQVERQTRRLIKVMGKRR